MRGNWSDVSDSFDFREQAKAGNGVSEVASEADMFAWAGVAAA